MYVFCHICSPKDVCLVISEALIMYMVHEKISLLGLGLWCLMPLSVISWWSVLLMQETGLYGENHRPATVTDKLYHIKLY